MAKKYILALIILVLIAFLAFNYLGTDTVDIYNDGENVSVTTHSISGVDTESLNKELCDYTINIMNDTTTDFSDYENGVKEMGLKRFAEIARVLEVSPAELLGTAGSCSGEAEDLFSQLDDDNRMIILKQMKALLLMQAKEKAS